MTESPNIAALWEDLKQLTKKVVAEMNRLEEFSNRTGGLECDFSDADKIVVTKQTSPSMSVAVTRRADSIDVHSRIVTGGALPLEREVRDNFAVQIDESGPSFRNRAGDLLSVDEAVYYILRPFLHLNSLVN